MDTGFQSLLKNSGLMPPADYAAQSEDIEKKRESAEAPYKEKIKENVAKEEGLYKQISESKNPDAPTLGDLPDEPDLKYQDPMKSLGSLGSLFAIIASGFTRAPLTSGLNSIAATMKGYHEGDQDRVKLEQEKWKDNFGKAIAQNKKELEQYQLALDKHGGDIEQAQAQMQGIAAANKDQTMLAALETGDLDQQQKLLDERQNAGSKMADIMIKHEEKNAAIAASKEKKWEVVTKPDGTLIRVNPETGEVAPFEGETKGATKFGAKSGLDVKDTQREKLVLGSAANAQRIWKDITEKYGDSPKVSEFVGTHPDTVGGKITYQMGRKLMLSSQQEKVDDDLSGLIDEGLPVFTGGLRSSDSYRQWLLSQLPNRIGDDDASAKEKMRIFMANIDGTSNAFKSKFASTPQYWGDAKENPSTIPISDVAGVIAPTGQVSDEDLLNKYK